MGERRELNSVFGVNVKRRGHLENLDVDGKIILRYILRK
jgi:hypothetical protein